MWILPKNYQLSSRYVADMVESKEDLTLQGLNIESSLLVKSKPSPLRTWLTRWKPTSFHPHLFIRILKPCQWNAFETELTSSLAVIHASHFRQQDSEKEQMIQDTSGLTSKKSSEQFDLFDASSRMSKDTLALDSEKSLATWKALVIKRRGEYSQRVKLALLTKEKESTSWATPNTMDHLTAKSPETLIRQSQTVRKGRTRPSNLREQVDPVAMQIYQGEWPTATVFDVTGGSYPTQLVNGQWRSKHSKDPDSPWYGAKLKDAVETAEKMWPTPRANKTTSENPETWLKRQAEGSVATPPLTLAAQMGTPDFRQWPTAEAKEESMPRGHLNPDWVEWLMGVPTGWTALGSWETELFHRQPLKHG